MQITFELLVSLGFPTKPFGVLNRFSIADLVRPGERCGIYALHLADGAFYIGQSGLEELLGVRSGRTWRACERWWLKREPLTTMSSLLNATRCLRDLTMHGLLSASRVKDFGLACSGGRNARILDQLLVELVRVASATVRVVLVESRARRIGGITSGSEIA